jgi:CRP-like cAMP-binding protein
MRDPDRVAALRVTTFRGRGGAQSPNRLLAALRPAEYVRLEPQLRTVPLPHKHELQKAGERARVVYFPGSGVCSVTTVMQDGRMVEVGTIGREGAVNFGAFFAPDVAQAFATIVQVPGESAQALPIDAYLSEMERKGSLFEAVMRYAQAYTLFTMQAAACNGLHAVEERCAKWLLMTQDRVGADTFQLTQEFFAVMLGVRRATVTVVAKTFQSAGLIQYARGVLTINDRDGLKEASCECYEVVARQFDDLLPA